jgi:flagellar biosynthesis/type III secretory pathway M-ring protein FliF/YscJ
MADTELTGAEKTVLVDTDKAEKTKKMIKIAVIAVVVLVVAWIVWKKVLKK